MLPNTYEQTAQRMIDNTLHLSSAQYVSQNIYSFASEAALPRQLEGDVLPAANQACPTSQLRCLFFFLLFIQRHVMQYAKNQAK